MLLKCICNTNKDLTIGKFYEVEAFNGFYSAVDDNGYSWLYNMSWFEDISEVRNRKLMELGIYESEIKKESYIYKILFQVKQLLCY
jgi:hypothetical protein